ncbi:hypothetical protein OIV19_23340 [Brucella sp. HL-2]|nr:hypothetical protein [Brucella sp. HL-2]MCV9910485.1 hypothetical protein [Brucella sp. HL-2]
MRQTQYSVPIDKQWRGKNLSNIVTLACKRWLAWLCKFRPKLGFNFTSKGVKKAVSSETFSKRTENKKSGQPPFYPKDSPSGGFQPFASRKLAFE